MFQLRSQFHQSTTTIGIIILLLCVITFPTFTDSLSVGTLPVKAKPTTKPTTTTSASTTIARKRVGKNSFIHKQEQGTIQKIATITELQTIASKNKNKRPGSKHYNKNWNHYVTVAINTIRYELSQNNLPHPPNKDTFEELFYNLGVAADNGIMPSFDDVGARSGYALEFFCRARFMADLYMDVLNPYYSSCLPSYWVDSMLETPMLGCNSRSDSSSSDSSSNSSSNSDTVTYNDHNDNDESNAYNIVSLGGGPGFDFVGAALAASFTSFHSNNNDNNNNDNNNNKNNNENNNDNNSNNHHKIKRRQKISATIVDYEKGWCDLVEAMDISTRNILQPLLQSNNESQDPQDSLLSCKWGGKCDITKPLLTHDDNKQSILSTIQNTNLYTCQYCVAENAYKLQQTNYIFFKELIHQATVGTIFVFTETHPRLWPDFYSWIESDCSFMIQFGFNKNGRQMLLRKYSDGLCQRQKQQQQQKQQQEGEEVVVVEEEERVIISKLDKELLLKFETMREDHERKINSGWERPQLQKK